MFVLCALSITAGSGLPVAVKPYARENREQWIEQLHTAFGEKTNRLPVRIALAWEFHVGRKRAARTKDDGPRVARFVVGQDDAVIPAQMIDSFLHVGDETAHSVFRAADADRAAFALRADPNRNLGATLRANRDWSTLQSLGRALR